MLQPELLPSRWKKRDPDFSAALPGDGPWRCRLLRPRRYAWSDPAFDAAVLREAPGGYKLHRSDGLHFFLPVRQRRRVRQRHLLPLHNSERYLPQGLRQGIGLLSGESDAEPLSLLELALTQTSLPGLRTPSGSIACLIFFSSWVGTSSLAYTLFRMPTPWWCDIVASWVFVTFAMASQMAQ